MKKTKIVCSIGPATYSPDVMEELVKAGMNVARINFSHATLEEKQTVVRAVKEVRKRTGKEIAILYDTKGPEFRNGMLENDEITLVEGENIRVVKDNVLGNRERFTVNFPSAIDSLEVGSVILLENGLMKIEVISIEEDGVTCKIVNGGILGNKKSLNVPGVKLDMPFISDQDREDIIYACQNDGDFLALSFVSCKEDVLEARKILKEYNRCDMKVISKIESTTGVANLDEIIAVSDGVMVARGDLGVEVPIHELPILQKMMIEKCRKQGKFCIVATEMLASMYKNSRPTRAEVSDIGNAVLDGTDAVMLSGETTVGKFPVDAVRYMADICEYMEGHINQNSMKLHSDDLDITDIVSKGVAFAVSKLDAKAIVAATMTGYTARNISRLRPDCTIMAACPNEGVARSLALNWGVYPVIVPIYNSTDEIMEGVREKAIEFMKLKEKDIIVIMGGFPTNKHISTNLMKIEEI